MYPTFKKIIFVTGLLNINNIKCSEEESSENNKIDKIKEKINKIYDYEKEPFELYKDKTKIKNYKLESDKESVKNVYNANDIQTLLTVKIDPYNRYYHYLKTLYLLKAYLLNYLNNIDKKVINILETFIKTKYKKDSDEDKNKQNSNKIVENIYLDFIELGLEKIRKRVNDNNFEGFNDDEFNYIKDDYFFKKKPEKILDENYKFLENFKDKLYENLKGTQELCTLKFLISDDLEPSKYFPKHWIKTKNVLKGYVDLKKSIYDYEFDNEGIKNKKGDNVINSSEELQEKFNKENNKDINNVLNNTTKYKNFKKYLELLDDFNNSINDLNTEDNLKFLDKLINNYDNVLEIDEDSVNFNTKIYVISPEDKGKIMDIGENLKNQNSILNNIKLIFKDFSNKKYNEFYKKMKELNQKNVLYKEKSAKIKEIKKEIKTLISEIKPKINILTDNNNGLEGKYKVEIPTISDEDYNNKTKNELNDIKNNLKVLEKKQKENIKKQNDEKDKALLDAAKDDEEKKKIENSIQLRKQISTKINEICENFEKEYNPTEEDNKSKIEKNLDLKLNENTDIKEYLENEFNKKNGLSTMLQNDLNSEKTKTINECEIKLNRFLQKKKEEEEKNKDKEKTGNSDDENNKNIKGDNKGKSGKGCSGNKCGNEGKNNTKSTKRKCCR